MQYNFYPIQAENASIYIGKGAGSRARKQMENAQHSIKVMSPYLSPDLINLLVQKASQGIEVLLITSDDRSSRFDRTGQGQVIQQLITQYRFINEDAKADKQQQIRTNQLLVGLFIVLIFVALFAMPNLNSKIGVAVLCLGLALFFSNKVKESKKHPIFYYSYSSKLNFKIIKQDILFHDFFHLKAYVVDGKTAYLGSLNFTHSGFKRNIESCITVKDQAAQAIDTYLTDIFTSTDIPFYSEQEIVHTYFYEQPY